VGANLGPYNAALRQSVAEAAIAGRGIQAGLGKGAAGIGSLNVIMRETFVILREISRGNWSRVTGSLSILAAQFGPLKFLFSAFGLVLVAVGAAAFGLYKHLKTVNEELDNTGNILSRGYGKMADAMQHARREAAVAAAEFISWQKKMADSGETLATKTERKLKLMREEAKLQREANPDKSKAAELRADEREAAAERDLLNDAVLKQQGILGGRMNAAQQAEFNANQSPDAIKRKGILGDSSAQADDLKKQILELQEMDKQLRPRFDAASRPGSFLRGYKSDEDIRQDKLKAVTTNYPVDIDGKKSLENLNDVSERLKKAQSSLASLNTETDRLAKIDRELADAARDTKEHTEKEREALQRLTDQRNDLADSIKLHEKYDGRIGGGLQRGNVTSLQQNGAYTSAASIASAQVSTAANTALIARRMEAAVQQLNRLNEQRKISLPFGGMIS
jgi:hypothetical protein